MGRFVTEALDGESVSHGGSCVRLYKGLQQTKLMFGIFVLRFFVSRNNIRLFVQTVWFRPDTVRPYELSDSVVFGRIVFVLFVSLYEEIFVCFQYYRHTMCIGRQPPLN